MSRPVLEVAVRRRIHPGLTVDVDFTLGDEVGVLFGRSGAGKSSILRMIAGLDRPDSGRIVVANIGRPIVVGERPLYDSAAGIYRRLSQRHLGFVTQRDTLFPHLDVRENIAYGLRAQVGVPRLVRERFAEVADAWEVRPLLDRRIGTLSGGERQRVALARAIAPHPGLLLADEPVSALDLDARYRLLTRLKAVQRAEGFPVLMVTHAVDEALAFGERLFLVEGGRVVARGTPAEVLGDLAARRFLADSRLQNVFRGVVADHAPPHRSTAVRLDDGPTLVVPSVDRPVGAPLLVRVDAEEIVLARGPIGELSARNLLPGTVDSVVPHDDAAEVFVRVGGLRWVVGVIGPTVGALGLAPGAAVTLIVKARSCHALPEPAPTEDRARWTRSTSTASSPSSPTTGPPESSPS